MDTWTLELAVIDWIAVGLLAGGYFLGLNKGLGPLFGMLLWLIAAMWIGKSVAPTLLSWMPNSAEGQPQHWHAQFMAFGSVTGTLLALPLVGKLIGIRNGKKKTPAEVHSKHFGSLVGLACAALFFTLACPFAHRFESVARSYPKAGSPSAASALANQMGYLYPASHRKALAETIERGRPADHQTRPAAAQQAPQRNRPINLR